MAGKNDSNYYICQSDQDILNSFARLKNLMIEKAFGVSTVDVNGQISLVSEEIIFGNSSVDSTYVSACSNPSKDSCVSKSSLNERVCDSFTNNSIHVEVLQSLICIREMFDNLNEQDGLWKTDNGIFIEEKLESVKNIISDSALNTRLNQINTTIDHVKKISEKALRLKQVLRSSDEKDFLKIHTEYHSHVVNFFLMSKTVLKDVEKDLHVFKNSQNADERDINYSTFLQNIQKLTKELHKSLDLLKEFRSHLNT